MANPPTGIINISFDPLTLPAPYDGVLPAGQMAIVADTPAQAQLILGGAAYTAKQLQFRVLPAGTLLTPHGTQNVDETLITALPTISVVKNTTRFDVLGGVGSASAVLPNGLYVGQRKQFYQSSATGTSSVTITPVTMSESKTNLQLKALGSFATMEWATDGWKIVAAGGTTGSAVALT